MILAPSCLGKLPSHGDFLRIRVSHVQKVKFDQWFSLLQKSPQEVKVDIDKDGIEPWCFVMKGKLLGASNHLFALGVLFDSFDKIGRRYPFVMYQLVPKRWLLNQLKDSKHWLRCLQQFAKICRNKDNSEIDTMLNQLWNNYKPQWLDYFRTPSLAERQKTFQQTEWMLKNWNLGALHKSELVGNICAPWADWPYNLSAKNCNSIWWRLDDSGRYLDCIEHQALDRALIEQLLEKK